MTPLALFGLGLQALTRNRMRSALTTLGIVIGVAAVIATLAIGEGAREQVQAQIRALGANTLFVFPGTQTAGGARGGMGSITTMTPEDAVAVRTECPAVDAVAPMVRTTAQVVAGNTNWSTAVQGTSPEFTTIRQWSVDEGVFFTDSDVRGAAKVAVLGAEVAAQLFGTTDPVGLTVRIKDIPFRVAGVLARKGGSGMGGNNDDVILVPITTAQHRLLGITYIQNMLVSAVSESEVPNAVTQITELLHQRHRIHAGEPDDFIIRTQLEAAQTAEQTSKTMTLLLSSIAAVSLIVGGLGIMNIMLVSVTERTREIGIRRAIGARRSDILLQFLAEAAFLSFAGGMMGVVLGVATARIVSQVAHWSTHVAPESILLAFGFATAVGLFFGFYPARRASGLDPVEALRYE